MKMGIICLETEAYYKLIQEFIDIIKKKEEQEEELWVDTKTAMSILKISSRTTLQKLRDNSEVVFSQPSRRVILYYRPSLIEYLENNIVK
jgi:hypothetical protein